MKKLCYFLAFAFFFSACKDYVPQKTATSTTNISNESPTESTLQLDPYWYQGKAELNKYELHQVRYKDVHKGEAVAIFVTEDFLTDKQVKNDNYTNKNSTPILKTNLIRRFPTGLYDYSIMNSVFTPVQTDIFPKTLKVTITAQDWCGHYFMQLNLERGQYDVRLHSYFENEGDKNFTVEAVLIEDELFNRIRMEPNDLPTGNIAILPSTVVIRFLHLNYAPILATAKRERYKGNDFEGKDLMAYQIEFPSLNRQLEIVYQKKPPYIIEGWVDTYPPAFTKEMMTTKATRKKTKMIDYWNKNGVEDQKMRKELKLMW